MATIESRSILEPSSILVKAITMSISILDSNRILASKGNYPDRDKDQRSGQDVIDLFSCFRRRNRSRNRKRRNLGQVFGCDARLRTGSARKPGPEAERDDRRPGVKGSRPGTGETKKTSATKIVKEHKWLAALPLRPK